MRDTVTGAATRATFQESLTREMARARRHGYSLALCALDIDHFKSVNDAFGHLRGDAILAEVARRVASPLRAGDLLGRMGGDEFMLLLPHTDLTQAGALAQRVLTAIVGTPFAGEPALTVGASIGIAAFPDDADDEERLMHSADLRLYAAKRLGRARICTEDAEPDRLDFTGSRLIEREEDLHTLRAFLKALPHRGRGLLAIDGPAGAGHSRFLAEVVRAAALEQYHIARLEGHFYMRERQYGALLGAEGFPAWPEDGAWEPAALRQALDRRVEADGKRGVVVALDEIAEADHASLELLQALLEDRSPVPTAIVFTSRHARAGGLAGSVPVHQASVTLAPLSPAGVRLWLRAVLSWEPPAPLCAWLHDQTGGLPAVLQERLSAMVGLHVLRPDGEGWLLQPNFAEVPLPAKRRAQPSVNVPPFAGSFIGRTREVQTLKTLLERRRLITVVGAGGSGKTRLAAQAAAEVADHFPHGVSFVSLAPVTSAYDLAPAIATALGCPPAGRSDPATALLAFLGERQMGIILDNFEHLLDGAALVARIVNGTPGVTVLVTSREPLHLPGEVTVALAGMPYPEQDDGTAIAHSAAVQLFLHRVRRSREQPPPDPEALPHIARICRLVEGLPLAIELAAAWAPILGPDAIAAAIAQNLDFLGAAPAAEVRSSARAVLAYFWQTLSADEQGVLRRLSLFRGGFGREAARKVAGASLFFLAALVDRAFLHTQGDGRYQIHELLRQYAAAELADHPEERHATHAAHAAYYLDFAETAKRSLRGPAQATWLDRLETEHDNLRAALDWSSGEPNPALALRLAGALCRFWQVRGYLAEGRRRLERALALPGDDQGEPGQIARASALTGAGSLAAEQGDYNQARALLDEACALYARAGDQAGLADAANLLGNVALQQGDLVTAARHYEECLAHRRLLDDSPGLWIVLSNLGKVATYQGEYDRARALYEESLALARDLDDRESLADAVNSLAILASDQGDYARAVPLYQEALALRRLIGHKAGVAAALLNLGTVSRNSGDLVGAEQPLREGLAMLRELGSKRGVAIAAMQLGKLAALQGHYEEAADQYREALSIGESIGDRQIIPFLLDRIAALVATRTHWRTAVTLSAAAARQRAAHGLPLPTADQDEQSRNLADWRAALGTPTFDNAWAEGTAWDIEETVAHARAALSAAT